MKIFFNFLNSFLSSVSNFINIWLGWIIPIRVIKYSLVGSIGVSSYFFVLFIFYKLINFNYHFTLIVALITSMTVAFSIHNVFTFKEKNLSGKEFFQGLFKFYLVGSLGSSLNFGVSTFFYFLSSDLWLIGPVCAIIITAIWNIILNSLFVWKIKLANLIELKKRSKSEDRKN